MSLGLILGLSLTFVAVAVPARATQAIYDSTLKAPRCGPGVAECDSGTLLVGRDTITGGAEPNQPNTINNSCPDGTFGTFHLDESNDRIKVSTLDGGVFGAGKTVRIDATVWAFEEPTTDFLDLYYTSNALTPTWTFLATLTPTLVGAQTLSATYILPVGGLQAVRARFRFVGSASSCSGSSDSFNDHDDLIFSVGGGPTDFDGDGKTDLPLWRPSISTFYWLTSSSAYNYASAGSKAWGSGAAGDTPLAGDIDGDGKADVIVWRPGDGTFYWLTSSTAYNYASAGSKQWGSGSQNDIPLLGDVDGDARADLIVWRPGNGTFYWLTSSTGYSYTSAGSRQWGLGSQGDLPLVGDVDGDGKSDLIVWRPGSGTFYWLTSSTGYNVALAGSKQWGLGSLGDIPLVRDIDGDGKTDLIVWRPANGTFYWLTSTSSYNYASAGTKQWGAAGDRPQAGDIDGDGKADLIVWRPGNGTFYWLTSSSAYNYASAGSKQWGAAGDIPLIK